MDVHRVVDDGDGGKNERLRGMDLNVEEEVVGVNRTYDNMDQGEGASYMVMVEVNEQEATYNDVRMILAPLEVFGLEDSERTYDVDNWEMINLDGVDLVD